MWTRGTYCRYIHWVGGRVPLLAAGMSGGLRVVLKTVNSVVMLVGE